MSLDGRNRSPHAGESIVLGGQRLRLVRLTGAARGDAGAQHVYRVAETGEEIVLDDRVLVTLEDDDPETLGKIAREHHLVAEGRMGDAHVLRLTPAAGRDPLAVAAEVARHHGVKSCQPQVLIEHQRHDSTHRAPR